MEQQASLTAATADPAVWYDVRVDAMVPLTQVDWECFQRRFWALKAENERLKAAEKARATAIKTTECPAPAPRISALFRAIRSR